MRLPFKCRTQSSNVTYSFDFLQYENYKFVLFTVIAYKCGKCNEPFENAKQLSHHFRIHNKAFPKCVVCGDNSVDIELDQHLCVQEEFMSCEYCSQTFTSTKRLLVHLDDDHSEEKKHRCSTCKLSFGMRFLKIIHEKSHNVIKPFKCDICSKSYVLQDSLIRHQQKEHTNPEECKI